MMEYANQFPATEGIVYKVHKLIKGTTDTITLARHLLHVLYLVKKEFLSTHGCRSPPDEVLDVY